MFRQEHSAAFSFACPEENFAQDTGGTAAAIAIDTKVSPDTIV